MYIVIYENAIGDKTIFGPFPDSKSAQDWSLEKANHWKEINKEQGEIIVSFSENTVTASGKDGFIWSSGVMHWEISQLIAE
jgi:hypothetical protein